MPTPHNYITGLTSEFEEFRNSIPVHLDLGGFFICTSGSGDIVINMKQYKTKAWDMLIALPHSFVQALHTSDDFDGVIFGVDMDLINSIQIPNKSSYFQIINTNPSVSIQESEAHKIIALKDWFLSEREKREHPLRNEIDESILKIMVYEIAALFGSNNTPIIEQRRSQDDIIFNNFVVELYRNIQNNRSLDYYAEKQAITAGHLSKVIKRVSGRTASNWISSCAIINIKGLLQDSRLSISSIAERLNFPNASFLSQYFKKHTGQSPKEYRSTIQNV